MPSRDLSYDLAEHGATYDAAKLSPEVSRHIGADLADTLAVALGGVNAPGVPATREFLAAESPAGPVTTWGTALQLTPLGAAAANATAAHALDFDDTLDEGGGMHAGAPVHAAALAVAQALGGVSGQEYAAATAVGLDVAVRLALAPTQDFGWHRTSAFGVFGATVAVGRLLKLDPDQLRNALGIAYSQASGNRQCIPDGALSKRLQAGFAARDAITAVELARRGLTGAHNAFEGPDGFFRLYQRDAFTRDTVTDGLGRDLLSVRISTKPYPCGRNLHSIIDAALEIRERSGGEAVKRITIGLDPRPLARTRREYPEHVVQAQFSPGFAVALAIATASTPVRAFDNPTSAPPEAIRLFGLIELVEGTNPDGSVRVAVTYEDGREESAGSLVALGNPQKPLSLAQLEAKAVDCIESAGWPITAEAGRKLVGLAAGLTHLASTNEITALLGTD